MAVECNRFRSFFLPLFVAQKSAAWSTNKPKNACRARLRITVHRMQRMMSNVYEGAPLGTDIDSEVSQILSTNR